jgi:DNA-binding NarL/FixJ family response regulator
MTLNNTIRVVIVDDHPLFREGVARTLAEEADLQIVGQGISADEALALTQQLAPDVLLLDIDIPGHGMSVIERIAHELPTRILMLTAAADEDYVIAALKAGAHGYALKGVSARELADIIRTVNAGKGYVPPELAARLLTGMVAPASAANQLDDLTDRERQILELVADGASNKEIAHALNVAEKTVKSYMTSIMQKLQVRNRVEAALLLRSSGTPQRRS